MPGAEVKNSSLAHAPSQPALEPMTKASGEPRSQSARIHSMLWALAPFAEEFLSADVRWWINLALKFFVNNHSIHATGFSP